MLSLTVRLLTGEELTVECHPGDTVADLRRALANRHPGLKRCKLNFRGAFLQEHDLVSSLSLRSGEYLVAFETRKKPKAQAPAPLIAAAVPADATPPESTPATAPGQQQFCTPPSSPRQRWAAHGSGGERDAPPLASPGRLDSLLPGYLSRPNPSPLKIRVLPAAASLSAAELSHPTAQSAADAGPEQHAGTGAATQARSLLALATARSGGVDAERSGTGGRLHSCGEDAAAGTPARVLHVWDDLRGELQAAAQSVQAAPGQQALDASPSGQAVAQRPTPPPQKHSSAACMDAQAADAALPTRPRQHARPWRGAGSKRKQPESATAPSPAQQPASGTSCCGTQGQPGDSGLAGEQLLLPAAELDAAAAGLALPPLAQQLEASFAVLAQVHAFLTAQHIQASWAHVRAAAGALRLARPLELQACRLIAALCPELVALRQHHRVEPRLHGDSWRLAVSSPRKARAVVAAAAATEAAAGGAEQPLPNPMQLRTDGAGTVLAGLTELGAARGGNDAAAAGASGAPAAREAGAAADDTLVVEVVDPGQGFLSRPIPPQYLQQLRGQALAAGSESAGDDGGPAGSDEEDVQLACSDSDGPADERPGTRGTSGTPAPGEAPGPAQPKRRVFRVNKLVRQRWCFRRALVRALLLVQRQQLAGQAGAEGAAAAGPEAGSEHGGAQAEAGAVGVQQVEVPSPRAARRLPRRGPGSASRGQAAPNRRAPVEGASGSVQWHPSFDPGAITEEQLVAAGEQLAAPARAAAEAAEREAGEADALVAARRGRRSGVPAQEGREAGQAAGPGAGRDRPQTASAAPPQLLKQHAPCLDTTEMGTVAFLHHLRQLPWYQGQAVHEERFAARQPRYAAPAAQLAPAVAAALQLRGVRRLFLHQAAAIDRLLQGRHTVVATSTASGKSLCYVVPILQALAQDPAACALLMFPTKALAQDQLRALRELLAAAFGSGGRQHVPAVEVYDGDTPAADRGAIRDRAQLLITNPDMLHQSVLPMHGDFGRLLANLRYVVVDEGHAYRGVFGCHAALVLRRLRRLCDRVYHSQPTFAVATATLANPREHACELLGVPEVEVVSEDGSPHGPRTFVMWNPPPKQGWGRFGRQQSHTEGRARSRQERQERQQERFRRRQEANQERGRGLVEGQADLSEAQRLSQAKLGRRRQQLEAAAGAMQQEQEGGQGGQAGCQLDQHTALQPPPPAEQECAPPPPERPRMTAALRRELAEARAALAAVGGSSRPQHAAGWLATAPSGPARPLIRRQPLGARAALEQLAAAAVVAAPPRGRRGSGGGHGLGGGPATTAADAASVEERDYRARLPGAKEWREAQARLAAAVAEERQPEGAPGDDAGDGSGSGGEEERRSSPIVELSLLLAECVQHGLRTIAFCNTRKLCELVTAYVREVLKCTAPHLAGSIAVYRAGYSPAERREIERALFQGSLRAVAATNALELGVDVGSLDCTLHLGFPGSVASLWQQAGRAGRREQPSLGIYLGWDGPLDQYFMRHPRHLFGRPIERAMVDPRNPSVLEAHLACAAAEAPLLLDDDQLYFGPGLPAVAAALKSSALLGPHPLAPSPRALHYIGAVANPASKISLRAIDPERFAIVDESLGGALLEEIEESKAFFEVYDGAVYMFQGRTYLCKKLDLDSRVAVVRPADVKYYTKCIDYTDVHVQGGRTAFAPLVQPAALAGPPAARAGSRPGGGVASADGRMQSRMPPAACSQALVTTRWLGFRRIWRGTGQVFDTVDLFLPDVQFETEAAYLRLPHATRRRLKAAGLPFREGLHAASHAVLNVLPLYLLCNPTDVGTECDSPFDTRFRPERLLIYDKHPGGIGLAAAAAPLLPELLRRALELVRECSCTGRSGCPACVQHTACSEYNAVLHKRAAAVLLESILDGDDDDVCATSESNL